MLSRAGLYWRTLRHLRPVQWAGRARLMLPRRRITPVVSPPGLRPAPGRWIAPVELPSAMIGPTAFRFIGIDGALPPAGGWDDPSREKLWRYNLHYFGDLTATGWARRQDWHRMLVTRWREENPVADGTGWEPYPTSLRIVNWIKRHLAEPFLDEAGLASLATQARALAGRLEWHLLGNHLFANAKALIFAGALFTGAEADRWRRTGLAIVRRQLHEQVLRDGGNFELSPMYHAIFTEDLLDLLNVAGCWPDTVPRDMVDDLRETSGRMLDWARTMAFPDGDIALFNDAAIGIAPTLSQLLAYATRLEVLVPAGSLPPVRHLADSGYVRAEAGDAVLITDVARVGPDYLPGHAHADTLSFELALGERRIIVNGGTSRYGTDSRRAYERGTTAHSTVTVAGRNSSEMWAGFRVGARARPRDIAIVQDGGTTTISAAHDGYVRLPGAPIHRRRWILTRAGLHVEDDVNGDAPAIARFILAPDVDATHEGDNVWRLAAGPAAIRLTVVAGEGTLIPATYSPRFGVPLDTSALEVRLAGGRSRVDFDWRTWS